MEKQCNQGYSCKYATKCTRKKRNESIILKTNMKRYYMSMRRCKNGEIRSIDRGFAWQSGSL